MDKKTKKRINTLIRYAVQMDNVYLKNELKQIKNELKTVNKWK